MVSETTMTGFIEFAKLRPNNHTVTLHHAEVHYLSNHEKYWAQHGFYFLKSMTEI